MIKKYWVVYYEKNNLNFKVEIMKNNLMLILVLKLNHCTWNLLLYNTFVPVNYFQIQLLLGTTVFAELISCCLSRLLYCAIDLMSRHP